jgi:hypothetical protein
VAVACSFAEDILRTLAGRVEALGRDPHRLTDQFRLVLPTRRRRRRDSSP